MAQLDHRQHIPREIFRRGGKDRFAVDHQRQAGVGLHEEGKRRAGGQGAHIVHQRRRLMPAVKAHRGHAQPFQHGDGAGNVCAGEQTAPLVKGEADKQRQISPSRPERLLGGQQAARRAHIRSHVAAHEARNGFPGNAHARAHTGRRSLAQMRGGRAEGVGGHDVAAGFQVAPVNLRNPVRIDKVPRFGPLAAGQAHVL